MNSVGFVTRLFRWENGRQNTGYQKMLLCGAKWPILFDVYLLRFKEDAEIPPHIDRVKFGRHFRLNIIMKNSKRGGIFRCKQPIYENSRIKYFRSDKSEHSVSKILEGTRYVLSIGWIRRS